MPQDGAMPQNKQIELMVEKAIEFYVDLIRNPKYGDKQNNLEGFASLIATHVKLSTKKDVSEDQIRRFEKSLKESIESQIKIGYKTINIESDWFPEGILAQACIDSEINPQYPSRFGNTIDLHDMEVRKAYFGHDSEIIFKK